MKLIKCKSCSEDISPKAATCPKCGHPNKQGSTARTIFYLLVIGWVLWMIFGVGSEQLLQQNMETAHNQVADDAVQQYQIAKRQGDRIQICVQAGMVTAAYLQAKDEASYQSWKSIEASDCRAAGLPR